MDNGFTTIVRRDTLEKIQVHDLKDIANIINETMDKMQHEMYERAKVRRNSMIYTATNYDEFKDIAMNKSGFIKINWCGDVACENKIKEDTGMKSRCIIKENTSDVCCVCGKTSKYEIYFGRQY